jgi:hypothetical protein
MQSLTIENLVNVFKKVRPIVATVTVFAYVNAFILPISSASANPDKYENERKVRKTRAPLMPEQKTGQGWFGTITDTVGRAFVSAGIFSASKDEAVVQEKCSMAIKPQADQQEFVDGVNDLFRRVYTLQTSAPEVKQDDAQGGVTYFAYAKKVTEQKLGELQDILKDRKTLKKQVKKTFDKAKQAEAQQALNRLGSLITEHKAQCQKELDYFSLNINPATPEQKEFVEGLNVLYFLLGQIQNNNVSDAKKVHKVPSLNETPTPEEKKTFIRKVIKYAHKDSQDGVDYFKAALKAEDDKALALERLGEAPKGLVKHLNVFTDTQLNDVRKALNHLSFMVANEKTAVESELKFLNFYLDEERETLNDIHTAYQKLSDETPLWKDMNQLQRVFSLVEGTLPESIEKAIQKHSLTSVMKEYAASKDGLTRVFATVVDKATSPTAAKAAVVMGLVNAPMMVSAALAMTNRVADIPYNKDTTTQVSQMVITGGTDPCNFYMLPSVSAGFFIYNTTTPNTTVTQTTINGFNQVQIIGSCTEMNQHTANAYFAPAIGYTGTETVQGGISDALSGGGGGPSWGIGRKLTPNFPVPPVFTAADFGDIANGARVSITQGQVPVTDPLWADTQVPIECIATHGNCGLVSAPQTPANTTLANLKANNFIFQHAGDNQVPVVKLRAGNPTGYTQWIDVTLRFAATTPPPSSGPDTTTIVGIVVGTVVGVAALVATIVPLWWYYKKKNRSEEQNKDIMILKKQCGLRFEIDDDGTISFLNELLVQCNAIGFNSMTEEEKKNFMAKDLRDAMENGQNGLRLDGGMFGKSVINLTGVNEQGRTNIIQNIAAQATGTYLLRNPNKKRSNTLLNEGGVLPIFQKPPVDYPVTITSNGNNSQSPNLAVYGAQNHQNDDEL